MYVEAIDGTAVSFLFSVANLLLRLSICSWPSPVRVLLLRNAYVKHLTFLILNSNINFLCKLGWWEWTIFEQQVRIWSENDRNCKHIRKYWCSSRLSRFQWKRRLVVNKRMIYWGLHCSAVIANKRATWILSVGYRQ